MGHCNIPSKIKKVPIRPPSFLEAIDLQKLLEEGVSFSSIVTPPHQRTKKGFREKGIGIAEVMGGKWNHSPLCLCMNI